MLRVQQRESVGFIRQNSEYKQPFIVFILTVRDEENTVGGAKFHGKN